MGLAIQFSIGLTISGIANIIGVVDCTGALQAVPIVLTR